VLPAGATFCPRCGGRVGPVEVAFESPTDDSELLDEEEVAEGAPPRQARYATTNALKYVIKSGRVNRGRANRPLVIAPPDPPEPAERAMPVLDYSPRNFPTQRPPPRPPTPKKKSNWPFIVVAALAVQMFRLLVTSDRSSSPAPTPTYKTPTYNRPKWKPTPPPSSPSSWNPAAPVWATPSAAHPIPGTSLAIDAQGRVIVLATRPTTQP